MGGGTRRTKRRVLLALPTRESSRLIDDRGRRRGVVVHSPSWLFSTIYTLEYDREIVISNFGHFHDRRRKQAGEREDLQSSYGSTHFLPAISVFPPFPQLHFLSQNSATAKETMHDDDELKEHTKARPPPPPPPPNNSRTNCQLILPTTAQRAWNSASSIVNPHPSSRMMRSQNISRRRPHHTPRTVT